MVESGHPLDREDEGPVAAQVAANTLMLVEITARSDAGCRAANTGSCLVVNSTCIAAELYLGSVFVPHLAYNGDEEQDNGQTARGCDSSPHRALPYRSCSPYRNDRYRNDQSYGGCR